MKSNIQILIFTLLVSLFASSCKPIYKCGEPKQAKKLATFFWTKRVKAVIDERDQLCADYRRSREVNIQLEIDTLEAGKTLRSKMRRIAGLENKNSELMASLDSANSKLDDLVNENITKAKQYSKALNEKSEQLKQRESELEEQKALLAKQQDLLAKREAALEELKARIARQDSITKALNDMIKKALLGFTSEELSVEIKNGKVYVSMYNKLLFKSGEWLVEEKGVQALEKIAKVLNGNTDISIMIEGHTDTDPMKGEIIKDNWDLSTARANSIVRVLVEQYKVDPKRVTSAGRGEYMPKASNKTLEGKATNRRTEIILSPNIEEILKLLGN